jgi:hypothetical protein
VLGYDLGQLADEIMFNSVECRAILGVQDHGVGVWDASRVVGNLGINHAKETATQFNWANRCVICPQRHEFSVRLGSLNDR